MDNKGQLNIYTSGWDRREIHWVNDFSGSLNVVYITFYHSKGGYHISNSSILVG